MEPKNKPFKGPKSRAFDFTFRDAGNGPGGFYGHGSVVGELDSYWTVVHPRSRALSSDALAEFVRTGKVLACHEGRVIAVGMINSATLNGRNLDIDASFHSTMSAQEWRTVMQERSDAGKENGLSMGFTVERYQYFPTGELMVKYLEETNEDMSMFNVGQLRAHDDDCWLMWVERYYEVSPVNFQSNEPSVTTSVRSSDATLGEVFARMAAKGVKISPEELLKDARDAKVLVEIEEDDDEDEPEEECTEEERAKLDEAAAYMQRSFGKRPA